MSIMLSHGGNARKQVRTNASGNVGENEFLFMGVGNVN
jgi:hypothetical protein